MWKCWVPAITWTTDTANNIDILLKGSCSQLLWKMIFYKLISNFIRRACSAAQNDLLKFKLIIREEDKSD